MKERYRIRHGGLMRCCLLALDDAMVKATEPPKEGDRVACPYCHDEYGMIFTNGAWQWAKTEHSMSACWFGRHWGAPFCDSTPQIPVPVGETCLWCEEPIAADDSGVRMPHISLQGTRYAYQHVECFLRSILGSVGHQLELCRCFGGNDDCEPPEMSRREAARAACDLAQSRWRQRYGS